MTVYEGPWTADVRSGADGSLIASIDEPFTELNIVDGKSWESAFIERQGEVELIDLDRGRSIGSWAGFGSDLIPMDRQFTPLTTAANHCLVVGARDGRDAAGSPRTMPKFFAISDDDTVLAAASLGGDIEVLRVGGSRGPVATLPGELWLRGGSARIPVPRASLRG